jgi:hypothetical protein
MKYKPAFLAMPWDQWEIANPFDDWIAARMQDHTIDTLVISRKDFQWLCFNYTVVASSRFVNREGYRIDANYIKEYLIGCKYILVRESESQIYFVNSEEWADEL